MKLYAERQQLGWWKDSHGEWIKLPVYDSITREMDEYAEKWISEYFLNPIR
jgi:hypothetical protein